MRMISPLAAAFAGALLLAGCGAPTVPAPTESPTAAASPTESAPPSTAGTDASIDAFVDLVAGAEMTTYTMDMVMSSEVEGTPMEVTSSGEFDTTDPAQPSSHLTMTVGGMELEMITVAGDYFLKMALTGDQWMKMDAATAQEMTGAAGPDLTNWAEQSRDSIESIELVGDDTLDGVAVQHYRLTMKPEALADLGVDESGETGAVVGYDVWVDADGFTRRFDAVVTGGSMPMELSATLGDFNEPVDITAPQDWIEAPA
ncbi:MAG: hypothetical protein AAGC63_14415 [Propionicimonas sp.]